MERRGNKKRKSESSSVISSDNAFAVLLAAISSPNHRSLRPLIKSCLTKLSHNNSSIPTISLLPTLFTRSSPSLASRAADMLGSAALYSLDMNLTVSSDADVIMALLSALSSSHAGLSFSACNALLDLCTTWVGRRRLVELSAIPRLLFRFLQVCRLGFEEDEISVLILNAAITLVNACDIDQLEKIPGKLSHDFLVFLRNLWAKMRSEMTLTNTFDSTQGKHLFDCNITVGSVAECLFRLSIFASELVTPLPVCVVERGIFGFSESGFKDFVLNHWELSPFLMRRLSAGALIEEDDLFGPFARLVNSVGTYPPFISSILPGMVSCLPIASDELNILTFLEEVKSKLGCPLIYQQDIRVVKTESKKEVHFVLDNLATCGTKHPHCLSTEDVLKCKEAFQEGYTVALRGMEFRFDSIAAISDGLASLFGQPSVGANMYLTPPNSQGLACHYDDHCVFVCQLVGAKKWRVCSQSNVQLPRLYDPLDKLHGLEIQNSMDDCKQYLLTEGDILYIPRGVLHEACTDNVRFDGSASCSLHLTLGIEVEPPFGWEGFVHIAFFSWHQNQKQLNSSFESEIIHDISVNLFHVAIGVIGDSDSTFRKACLIASIFSQPSTHNWHYLNQKIIFRQLIDKINSETRFLEVFKTVELASQKNTDPFHRIRWLGFLNLQESSPNHDQNTPFTGMENLFTLCIQHKEKVEVAFQQLTSRFCRNLIFEDAVVSYRILLDKYRKVRKQYKNGMVSLHHQI